MNQVEHTDELGRKYRAIAGEGDMRIILGPPEGLVDEMGLPEGLATALHNILYARGLFTYNDVCKRPSEIFGTIQELYQLDAQKLMAKFSDYDKE